MPEIGVLFVCYGNICRSPTAELVFRDLVAGRGLSGRIRCDSCGTSGKNEGLGMDPRSLRELSRHGISGDSKRARRIRRSDLSSNDYIVCMDEMNLAALERMDAGGSGAEVSLLGSHAGIGSIDDPWYSGDFARAYREIEAGCEGLLEHIREREGFRRGPSSPWRCPAPRGWTPSSGT